MRSALCAALMLHIFHKYADRIRIANLAQTINVLQAILLTEGGKMIKTPTYHVFDLLQGHQDADFVPVTWEAEPDTIQKESSAGGRIRVRQGGHADRFAGQPFRRTGG